MSSSTLSFPAPTERQAALRLVQSLPRAIARQFSPAELELLPLVCAGLCNKEIASELSKAEATVQQQVSSCCRKLNVPSRAGLVVRLLAFHHAGAEAAMGGGAPRLPFPP